MGGRLPISFLLLFKERQEIQLQWFYLLHTIEMKPMGVGGTADSFGDYNGLRNKALLEVLISDTQFFTLMGDGEQWESVYIFLGGRGLKNKQNKTRIWGSALKEWVFVLCIRQQGDWEWWINTHTRTRVCTNPTVLNLQINLRDSSRL